MSTGDHILNCTGLGNLDGGSPEDVSSNASGKSAAVMPLSIESCHARKLEACFLVKTG